ncbi:MAG: ATP-binding cassette domain-containing protein [Blastocatellia bacterium]
MATNLIDSVQAEKRSATEAAGYEAPAQVIVRNLVKRYGDLTAVAGASFDVRRGEVFGLLGPNGAGKTTTVEIIEGLRSRDGGEVTVCGFDPVENVNEVKQRIGVALQATALPDKIEVREALALFADFYSRRADVDGLLQMVSLEEKAQSRFDTLSGGQQQRLAVALALVNDPEVLILDEPTTGLDARARRELHGVIEGLKSESKTVILTTHYIEEAEKLCDRVAIIDHGRVIASGAPRDLIARARGQSRIELRTATPVELAELRLIPFVESVTESGGAYLLRSGDAPRTLIELIKWMEAERHELVDLHITRPTLEDTFIEFTGKRIRE